MAELTKLGLWRRLVSRFGLVGSRGSMQMLTAIQPVIAVPFEHRKRVIYDFTGEHFSGGGYESFKTVPATKRWIVRRVLCSHASNTFDVLAVFDGVARHAFFTQAAASSIDSGALEEGAVIAEAGDAVQVKNSVGAGNFVTGSLVYDEEDVE